MTIRSQSNWKFVLIVCATPILSACGNYFGGHLDQGNLVIESQTGVHHAYVVSNSKFQARVAPIKDNDDGAALRALDQLGSVQIGDVIRHEAGNFWLVFACGERVRNRNIWIQVTDVKAPPQKFSANCTS